MYYYNTDISINMLHVAVFVSVFSTLGAVIDTAPVSYTHLDVYKRQGFCI